MVALSDPQDHVEVKASTIEAERGIVIEAAGTRDSTNTGGSLRFVQSELAASDPDGAGVTLSTSEHDGQFRSENLIIDTPDAPTIVAGDCRIHRHGAGEPVDCDTDTLVEELQRQAEEIRAE